MKQHFVRLGSALSSAVSTVLAFLLATLVAGLAFLLPAQTETLPPLFGTQLPAELIPDFGSFYSAQLTNQPPLPYDPFPELPVYLVDAELEIFLIDDRYFDYDAWRKEQAALREIEAAALGVSVEELFGGGGAYGPLGFSSEGLRLLLPVWQTNQVLLPFAGGQTNGVYDLFGTTNMSPNAPGFNPTNPALSSLNGTNWVWLDRCDPGETNFTQLLISDSEAYYRLGTTNDTDSDGLTDAFENLVSHSDDNDVDSDDDGMPDGWEWDYLGTHAETASDDHDGDGVTNLDEYQSGLNPTTADTDGDGWIDQLFRVRIEFPR